MLANHMITRNRFVKSSFVMLLHGGYEDAGVSTIADLVSSHCIRSQYMVFCKAVVLKRFIG